MSADEFWKDDPQLFVSYRISFVNKKKREIDEEDYRSWLRGLYIYDGSNKISASMKQFLANMVSSAFKGKKDTTKIDTYPTKPYNELSKDIEQEKELKEQQQKNNYKNYEKSLMYFGTLKQQYKEKLKKGD